MKGQSETQRVDSAWERRVAELWASMDEYSENEFVAKFQALFAERPAGDARALYELGSAYDSTGHPHEAAPLYQQALAAGLASSHRRQAVIQLASTLRNLGQAEESVALLDAERSAGSDELDDAVAAFLALALVSAGREREAVAVALGALSGHMTRYKRSLTNYAKELIE